jgi:hypothetical protein
MADADNGTELSYRVASRAARAGMWMTAAGAALFVAGMLAGLMLNRQTVGQPVPTGEGIPPRPEAGPYAERQNDEEIKIDVWLKGDPEPGSPQMLDAVARRVREVLKLDDDQERQVRAIIDKHHPRMEALRKQFEPELRKLALAAMLDLWPVLKDEQRKRLERILGRHGRWLIRSVTQPSLVLEEQDVEVGNRDSQPKGE